MNLKKILVLGILTGAFIGCSSPQNIVLKDNTVIETKDEVEYNKKSGFYRYEDEDGNESLINASEIKVIKED